MFIIKQRGHGSFSTENKGLSFSPSICYFPFFPFFSLQIHLTFYQIFLFEFYSFLSFSLSVTVMGFLTGMYTLFIFSPVQFSRV